jgi:eukaryotic-like serine/threonine-protein kinase
MIDQVFGHYKILEEIGSGGMGEVYRARDDRLGRDVALKALKQSFANEPDRLRRFEQEARSAATLSHPNIVAVYDIDLNGAIPYIVTELLEGKTLRERLRDGALPLRQAADYATQIAQGLAAAHEKHIVHRDLKPENLFITKDGRIKILDFGIAKLTSHEPGTDESIATMTTQTKAGSVLGTVAYMSPEQLRGKQVDERGDLFSLGAILYEMLTGKRAFAGETEVDTITAVLKEEPAEMVLVRSGIPVAFEQITRHCLEKEPDRRFQSALDLVFALEAVRDLSTSRPMVALRGRNWRLAKRAIWILAAGLIAVSGIVVGHKLKRPVSPLYERLTFQRGTVYSARFAPDGHAILYSAAWNGRPVEVFSTIGNSLMARPVGFESTELLAVSAENELALAMNGGNTSFREFSHGMLASAPLVGGTPREILEDVRWADWSPDGTLAVVHHLTGHTRVEFPIGTVLYDTPGWVTDLRFSPKGDELAFLDHPELEDDRGSVCVMDLNGNRKTLSSGWESEDGLAWSPEGKEVWFSAATSGFDRAIWAVDLGGKVRKVLAGPGGFTLRDISADGRVLATLDSERLAMEWAARNGDQARDLSWYHWTVPADLSKDGDSVLFQESSEPVGSRYAVAIRKIDGSPPTRLGEGSAGGLSPDGKWASAIIDGTPDHLVMYPLGPGQPVQIPTPGIERMDNGYAQFSADGKSIIISGNEPGRPRRSFRIDIANKTVTPITPEGFVASVLSPDGKYLVGRDAEHRVILFPVAGGDPQPIPGLDAKYIVTRWSADSKAVYAYAVGDIPLNVYRVDVMTGQRRLLQQLVPADRGGVLRVGPAVTNSSAPGFAYSYLQVISNLYVISGLD